MYKLLIGITFIVCQSCATQKVLQNNRIDLTIDEPEFSEIIVADNANIFWLGEQHGTQDNYIIALKFLKYLIHENDLNYILIENSFLTEIFLNKYLETGNETFLLESIKNYNGTFYSNEQLKSYLKNIYNLYTELPRNNKFRFVSIDIEQTYLPSENYLVSYLKKEKLYGDFTKEINFDIQKDNLSRIRYFTDLQRFLKSEKVENDTINYMTQNMINTLIAYENGKNWDSIRDSLIYNNFKIRNNTHDFKNSVSFAFWGTDHCYKSANKNNVKWIASLIQEYHSDIKQNSTVMLYDKCRFLRHRSKFPKMSRFLFKKIDDNFLSHKFQNEPFQKLKDKKYLKRNKANRITMWGVKNLNAQWNFVSKKDKQKPTIDYIDNVILVVESKPCTPYYGN